MLQVAAKSRSPIFCATFKTTEKYKGRAAGPIFRRINNYKLSLLQHIYDYHNYLHIYFPYMYNINEIRIVSLKFQYYHMHIISLSQNLATKLTQYTAPMKK